MSRLELSAFAEQILHATTLPEKLVEAELIADARERAPLERVPAWPARPPGLEPDRDPRASLSPRRIESEADRARLLQALANHELLALELMALVLLRFPDAPPAFRMGLAHTMQDEQRHLALYLERLRCLGHELGEDPLSGYFWRALSDVRSPLDFVVRMSLTFEQANLDFARHYEALFRQAGDAETAAVLDVVYRDEIGHVAHGLRWFRRWGDDPHESDWARYRRLLPAPLTPSRAKGPLFDEAGRRQAGLDEAFLSALRVYASSKGRPPVVHLFNPGCELEQADGRPGYRPPKLVERLAADLAPSLAFVAKRDDLVVVPRLPSQGWLQSLRSLGWELPELLEADPESLPARLHDRTLGGLRPWGWSPRLRAALAPLAGQLSAATLPSDDDVARTRALASKVWSAEQAQALHAHLSGLHRGLSKLGPAWWTAGRVCRDETAARAAVAELSGRGAHAVALKAPWGSSGRGAVRVLGGVWATDQERWLTRTLQAQGAVVVEPWLERLVDLSLQLEVDDARVRELGLTRFLTDARGQYRGCAVGPALHGLDGELLRALHGDGLLAQLREAGSFVGERLRAEGHRGPAGIDAFLFRRDGAVRLRPLVEVNPRLTMGRLALALGERLAPGKSGLWRQLRGPDLRPSAQATAERLLAAHPPRIDAHGRLLEGAVCTNDPAQAELALGVLQVVPPSP
jgi:uncharacterized ferritin-like protein (DUF455 family)